MATSFVYRRPFDFRRPTPQWLLLRPDLDITAGTAALVLAEQQATVTGGLIVEADSASLALAAQTATISSGLTVLANAGTLGLAGAQASVVFLDTTAFTFRDVPPLVPVLHGGVYRRGFTVRRARPPMVVPRQVTTGIFDANRAQLTLSGQPATVDFDETTRPWMLHEAVRAALARRQIAYRPPLDMRPWDARFAQFTVPTNNLTAYTRELTLTGQQSTVSLSRALAAQLAAVALTGPRAAINFGKAIVASAAALTLTGQQARVGTGLTVSATVAALVLAGETSDTDLDKSIQASSASLVMSGLVASFGSHMNIAASVSVLALTGQAATARVEKAVAALAAALSLNAHAASTGLSLSIDATAAELLLSAHAGETQVERLIQASLAELSLDEHQALVEGTQAVIVQIGRRTVRVRARNSTITVH
jgi:hypothetical protein